MHLVVYTRLSISMFVSPLTAIHQGGIIGPIYRKIFNRRAQLLGNAGCKITGFHDLTINSPYTEEDALLIPK